MSKWHEWGVQPQICFGPAPWGFGEGSKGQILFNFNYKVNFKDFYTKLCVCSHKWKIQNISDRIFILSPWSCPRGGGAGCAQGAKKIFFQTWSCGISNRGGWPAEQNASKNFILGSNLWPWGEVKGQISLNFGYHVNFKDFYTKYCVCSHNWKILNISDAIFILLSGSCPRGGTSGHWGYLGGQTIFFQTWSCSISNRRVWQAEQNASNIFILGSNWWPWGKVKRSNIINMSISKIL